MSLRHPRRSLPPPPRDISFLLFLLLAKALLNFYGSWNAVTCSLMKPALPAKRRVTNRRRRHALCRAIRQARRISVSYCKVCVLALCW